MTVDEELMEFEENLRNVLDYNLLVNINWEYWEEMDEPNREFFIGLDMAIGHAFDPLIAKYRQTPVVAILQTTCEIIRLVARASMNVPFPRHPELHATRVSDNLMEVYNTTTYAQLRTEMIMTQHYASVIQRVWKDAIARPTHPICRRRLSYEFNECANNLELLCV
jgi:hypothetical protein